MKFKGISTMGFLQILIVYISKVSSLTIDASFSEDGQDSYTRVKRQGGCLADTDFVLLNENRRLNILNNPENRGKVHRYSATFTMLRREICSGQDMVTQQTYQNKQSFSLPEQIHGLTEICLTPMRRIQPNQCRPTCQTAMVGNAHHFDLSVSNLDATTGESNITLNWNAPEEWKTECSFYGYQFNITEYIGDTWTEDFEPIFVPLDCTTECTYDLTEIDTSTKNYKLAVTPIFHGDKKGDAITVISKKMSECFQRLTNLEVMFENNVLKGKWEQQYPDEIVEQYQITVKQMSMKTCGGSNLGTESYTRLPVHHQQFISNGFRLEYCVQGVDENKTPYCEMENKICEHVKSPDEIPLAVDSFTSEPKDTSLLLKWTIPEYWYEFCHLDYFEIHERETGLYQNVDPKISCSLRLCYYSFENLNEQTHYTFMVTPVFKGEIKGAFKLQEVETFSKLPNVPGLIKKDDLEKDVLVLYESHKRFHKCTIYVTGSNMKDSYTFNCMEKSYMVKFSDVSSGCQYNIFIEVCNRDGGCSKSEEHKTWTPPEVPQISNKIELVNSTEKAMTFILPTLKKRTAGIKGESYIIITSDEKVVRNTKKRNLIDFVKKPKHDGRIYSTHEKYEPDEDMSILKALPLTESLIVMENFFNETSKNSTTKNNKFWIAIVVEVESGKYQKYQASKFSGPYTFGMSFREPSGFNWVALAWAIGTVSTFLLLIAVVVSQSRKRDKVEIMAPLNPKESRKKVEISEPMSEFSQSIQLENQSEDKSVSLEDKSAPMEDKSDQSVKSEDKSEDKSDK